MTPRVRCFATLFILGAAFVLLAFVPVASANPGIKVDCVPTGSLICLTVIFLPSQTKTIHYQVIWDVGAGHTICVWTSVGIAGACGAGVPGNNGFTWVLVGEVGVTESFTFVTPTATGSRPVDLTVTAPSTVGARGSVTINACETIAATVCGSQTSSLTTELIVAPEFAVASVVPAVLGFGAVMFLRRRSSRIVNLA